MGNPLVLVIVITVVLLVPFLFFMVIGYTRSDYVLTYRRFKKPVQTTGVIEWVECVSDSQGECQYITTYSYIDNRGERRTVAFRWQKRLGWPGDAIEIHFDSQDPENSIADCQLQYGRRVWKNILITISATVIFTLLGILFTHK